MCVFSTNKNQVNDYLVIHMGVIHISTNLYECMLFKSIRTHVIKNWQKNAQISEDRAIKQLSKWMLFMSLSVDVSFEVPVIEQMYDVTKPLCWVLEISLTNIGLVRQPSHCSNNHNNENGSSGASKQNILWKWSIHIRHVFLHKFFLALPSC